MIKGIRILIVLLLLGSCSALLAEERVDGRWWSRLSAERKETFLIGYIHCLLDERLFHWDEDMYFNMATMLAAVDAYFQGDSHRQSEPVWPVLDRLIPRYMERIKRAEGMPEYPCGPDAPYGASGGEFWAGLHFSPAEGITARGAYLTGYLECYRTHVKGGLHFSKPVSFYEAKLNEFYGIVDDPEDPDAISEFKEELACFPIAEALRKYADEVLEKQKR